MAVKKLNIVIWCGDAPNQKALANKMAKEFTIAGIVVDTFANRKKKRTLFQLPGIILDRIRFSTIYNAWKNLMEYYGKKFPDWPAVPVIKVSTINDPATKNATDEWKPDLVIVSGTALVREPLLHIEGAIGIINLHTGLSPYVKGGPNCTNWCIANNDFHLTGNTIMWLSAGIDSGNIITTETVNIRDAVDLDEAHRIVMDHAHDLYTRATRYIAENTLAYTAVPQSSIDKGNLYLTRMWTAQKRKQLLANWKNRKAFVAPYSPTTIPLNK